LVSFSPFTTTAREISMKTRSVISLAVAMLFAATLYAADIEKAKCPVSGKECKEDTGVDYKGAKVFFCCNNCPKAFAKDKEKYAAKANAQLVATGQAKEVKCPLSGQDLNPETAIEVDGVKVCFCCNKCKKAVSDKKGNDQIEMVFGDKAFEKGFEVSKK
jgi:YHS domain-containing protein